ncbi:MAG: transglycosylase SLT domain-containing protein [Erysipelotrichales bacterium]|nr:transglycosylase SLT domain-containing protein [Erysipelotrichales bacterium]
MKRGYIFSIKNNELICTRLVDGKTTQFIGESAVNLLKKKDKIKFTKAQASDNSVLLESKNTRVYVNKEVLFGEHNYSSCLYHNMVRITKAINKYDKGNKGIIVKGIGGGILSAGILVAIALAVSSGKTKDNTVLDNIQFDEIEDFDNNEEELITENDRYDAIKDVQFVQDIEIPGYEDYYFKIDDNELDVQPKYEDYYDTDKLIEELEKNSEVVNLTYDDTYDQVKFQHVYDNYIEMINERATRWGVSPELMICFLAQESGGYESNLMQIQFNSWKDQPITLYNFEKGDYETIVLTNNPENYQNRASTQLISEEDLMNPKTNISIACIILRYSFDRMDHNMMASIQAYNFGVNNMMKVLEETARQNNTTVEALLSDQNNTEFLNYRNIISVGDPKYVENVLRYLQNPEEGISIRYMDSNGEMQETFVTIQNESKRKV